MPATDTHPPRLLLRSLGGLALVATLLLTGCATPSTGDRAADSAAELASADVREMAASVTFTLKGTGAPEQILESARAAALSHGRWPQVLAATLRGQQIRIDIATVARADAGGGLDAAQALVRVCARLKGRPSPRAKVIVSPLDCPAGLPDYVTGVGEITEQRSYAG